jgi:hypothetical protein
VKTTTFHAMLNPSRISHGRHRDPREKIPGLRLGTSDN